MDDRITSDVPVANGTPAHRSRRMRVVGIVVALLAASLAAVGPAVAETVVIVGAGDSLSEIAVENGVSLIDLMVANNINNPDLVFMGQRLVIPGTGSSSSSGSSSATGIRVVQWGDTLSVIAEDFGTTVSELMSLNGLSIANSLFVGQELIVPGGVGTVSTLGPTIVNVQSGESLSLIAGRYAVTVADLMAENGISDPNLVYVGQRLTIPGFVTATATTAPLLVTVQSGESLSIIAGRYDVTVSAIMEANGLTDANMLSVGQQLVIPGASAPATGPVASTDYGAVVVDGRGWGHGRGMGQYGALGYAVDEGWTSAQILDHYYGGTVAATVAPSDIGIRLLSRDNEATTVYVENAVLLVAGEAGNWTALSGKSVRVTLDGDVDQYRVAVGNGCTGSFSDTGIVIQSPFVRIRAGFNGTPPAAPTTTSTTTTSTTTSTTTTAAGATTTSTTAVPSPTTTTPPATTTTTPPPTTSTPTVTSGGITVLGFGDDGLDQTLQLCEGSNAATWYRGEIRAARYEHHQRTVNFLPVEQYLRSVVPQEMPASWASMGGGAGAQAVRVQAVAARSYALAEQRYDYAKTCDTIRCQVYEGRRSWSGSSVWNNEESASDVAILATAGVVRMRDGEIARTEFSASTGGYTITADFPGVVDDGDDVSINPVHRWSAEFDAGTVADTFGLGQLYEIRVVSRDGFGDDGGRAEEIELRTRSGESFVVTGNRFRREFGLMSNWYGIAYGPPNASSVFPENLIDEYRVTTGYTEDEWNSVLSAAEYLEMSPAELHLSSMAVMSFLLLLRGDGPPPAPLDPPPSVDGPREVTTAYLSTRGDQSAVEAVATAFSINGAQTQKAAVTVLVFLVGLARAAAGSGT
ncbi:MAG: hypothetical protein CL505_06745 [Actinobacteria bacterium]|nr:hypothetical protein [Actinomycetota bacterium]